jgi:hypothetical protein
MSTENIFPWFTVDMAIKLLNKLKLNMFKILSHILMYGTTKKEFGISQPLKLIMNQTDITKDQSTILQLQNGIDLLFNLKFNLLIC